MASLSELSEVPSVHAWLSELASESAPPGWGQCAEDYCFMANCRGLAECWGQPNSKHSTVKAPGAGARAFRPSGPKLEHEGAISLLMARVAPAAHCNVKIVNLIAKPN